jgi:hypothetical protein
MKPSVQWSSSRLYRSIDGIQPKPHAPRARKRLSAWNQLKPRGTTGTALAGLRPLSPPVTRQHTIGMKTGLLVGLAVLFAACGSTSGGTQATPTPSPSPLGCTTSGPASASWVAAEPPPPPIVSAVAAGDTLTFAFERGTPEFEVQPQAGPHFLVGGGRGTWVDVPGSAGAVIVLKGFMGAVENYTGPTSIESQGPLLLEVRYMTGFEGYEYWAVGLSKPGCANVTAAGSTLTFHFISSPPVSTPTPVDVAGAEQAALGLFVADPALSGHWVACSNSDNWAACPLSAAVKARLADLISRLYFSSGPSGHCGEEYISGTQNGFNNAPKVLSAVAGSNGSVTVVIERGPSQPNLTAVMTIENGMWLASDLASGTGPSASIFSAMPNC